MHALVAFFAQVPQEMLCGYPPYRDVLVDMFTVMKKYSTGLTNSGRIRDSTIHVHPAFDASRYEREGLEDLFMCSNVM